jgi:hypothetical protein
MACLADAWSLERLTMLAKRDAERGDGSIIPFRHARA